MAHPTNVLATHSLFSLKVKYSNEPISYHCANRRGLEKGRLTDEVQAGVNTLNITLTPSAWFTGWL